MAAPTDPSLLAAEPEEAAAAAALRRMLGTMTEGDEEPPPPPPAGPSATITPQPGFCLKTRAGEGGPKVFVNVCHSPHVPPPPPLPPPPELRLRLRSGGAGDFRIPLSLGGAHEERDRGGRPCVAYDVVVNSGLLRTLEEDPLLLQFFVTVTMEGLARKFGVAVDHPGWRLLRNRRFLGSLGPQNIRAAPPPPIQELGGEEAPESPPPSPPPHVVLAQPSARSPRELLARVQLPPPAGARHVSLWLSEELLELRGEGGGAGGGPALLRLGLPLPPDPARCRARLHRPSRVLTVTMPLKI